MTYNWDKVIYPFSHTTRKWLAIMYLVIILISWYSWSPFNFNAVLWGPLQWKHLWTLLGIMLINWIRKPLKGGF